MSWPMVGRHLGIYPMISRKPPITDVRVSSNCKIAANTPSKNSIYIIDQENRR